MTAKDGQESARRMAAASHDLLAGFAHHQAGRRDQAEALYRKVLRKVPDHPDGLHLLGVIAYERGRAQRAVQLISRALAASPGLADGHLNLGNAFLALGRLDDAAASYRAVLELKPDSGQAHCNLSLVLNSQGAFEEALASALRAVRLMPERGEAHLQLARAFAGQRRFIEAEPAYRRALALQPDSAEALSDLGDVLTELLRFDEAAAVHRRAIALRPDNAVMQHRLGMMFIRSGHAHEAEANFRRVTSIDPGFAPAWSMLGQMLRALGRFAEARAAFHRALELDPGQPQAAAGLAAIGQSADDPVQITRLRAVLAGSDRPLTDRIDAGFALGMLLDNADRCDEAFPCFAEANALYRQSLWATGIRFDAAALRQKIDGLIANCTPALFSAVEGGGNPSQLPVFIVGMPRSGTSLIEQIAASHSRVYGAGELGNIRDIAIALEVHGRDRPASASNPNLARRLADGYVEKLHCRAPEKERVIDKTPYNILQLGMIGVLFPGARVIFCRRDLRDTCLSCYFRKFDEPTAWAYDLTDCGHQALETERLAGYWRRVLPLRMLTVDYESVVADLEGESRRLIEFLGLDWEPACLDFHRTERPVLTGAWQVRQPIYDRSVGRWRKYEKHLGPLFRVLAAGGVTGSSAV
jgi:tetratricopeptide (TPR) repeat protein